MFNAFICIDQYLTKQKANSVDFSNFIYVF